MRLFAALVFCTLAGCASTHWEERVGLWTYDDVVRELGPADLVEDLSDGSRVVTYFRERTTYATSYVQGRRGRYGRRSVVTETVTTPVPRTEREIFIFDPNGFLESRRSRFN